LPLAQVAIVQFLDWANGRLERAIRAKRKVIALLTEQKQVLSDTTGTAQFNVSTNDIENVAVTLPPLNEQESIVSQIAKEVEPIATAITRLEREIELLREYRTRLVAEVVTGKLDVREAAGRLPEEASGSDKSDKSDESDESDLSDLSDLSDGAEPLPEEGL